MFARRMLLVILITCLMLQIPGSASSSAAGGPYGNRLGPEFRISEPTAGAQPERYEPAVAYNRVHHEYLVLWENSWAYSPTEIYAQRVSASGQLISGFLAASGVGGDGRPRTAPAVAYNAAADEYLVVYVYEVVDELDYDIRGRRISWDGSWIGPEFEILSWANRGFFLPRVAWNPYRNQYLVISSVEDTVSKKMNDVAGRRVMADGTTPYPVHNISAQSQTLQPQGGDVTYNIAADEYLVVWRQNYTGDDWDIWGARVQGIDDAVVSPGPFSIDTASVDQDHPAVATNTQDRYLVVWEQGLGMPATDWDIYGRELDINGGQTTVNSFSIASSSDPETFPDVEINGANNQRMVVWRRKIGTGYAIWQFGWFPSVMTLWLPFEIAPTSPVHTLPAIAAGSPGFLSVYEKRETTSFIYGRLYWEYNLYLPHISKN